eukprot:UN00540
MSNRKDINSIPIDCSPLRVVVSGAVDSGKSTFTGVLISGENDNNGHARRHVVIHPHEIITNKTSSSTHHYFAYSATGQHLSYATMPKKLIQQQNVYNNNSNNSKKGKHHNDNNNNVNKTTSPEMIIAKQQTQLNAKNRAAFCQYLAQQQQKENMRIVTLVDSAGHTKYLKNTSHAVNAQKPDLALVMISPHTGLTQNTIEHISLALALHLRIVFVVTKIDRAENVYSLKQLRNTLLQFVTAQCHRKPIMIRQLSDVCNALLGDENGNDANVIPNFLCF